MTNPTVNSYKRLNASTTASGATVANAVTYGGNNRSHMIRIPEDNRVELRVADGAATHTCCKQLVWLVRFRD